MALSHAWVTAIASSSSSSRLNPSRLPRRFATDLATVTKSASAGIFSSVSTWRPISGLRPDGVAVAHVGLPGLLLQLLATLPRRLDAVLDRFAQRVVGVAHRRLRLFRG